MRKLFHDADSYKFFPEGFEFIGKVPIPAMFFPDQYEKHFGNKPVSMDSVWGPIEMKPLLSTKLEFFLDGQGPGSTDTYIPLYGEVSRLRDVLFTPPEAREDSGDKVVVFCNGTDGCAVLIYTKQEFALEYATSEVEHILGIDEWDDDWDDEQEEDY